MYTFTDKARRRITLRPEGLLLLSDVMSKTTSITFLPAEILLLRPDVQIRKATGGRFRQFFRSAPRLLALESRNRCRDALDAETFFRKAWA